MLRVFMFSDVLASKGLSLYRLFEAKTRNFKAHASTYCGERSLKIARLVTPTGDR